MDGLARLYGDVEAYRCPECGKWPHVQPGIDTTGLAETVGSAPGTFAYVIHRLPLPPTAVLSCDCQPCPIAPPAPDVFIIGTPKDFLLYRRK